MITDELENELRRTFARADAEIAVPDQARQRLLQRDYHPGRGNRRLAASITAAAATALVLGLGLSGVIDSAPAHPTATIRTAAFTLVEHVNGTATLTLNLNVLFAPRVLQRDLRHDGIPAIVTSGSFCSSHPALAGFSRVVFVYPIDLRLGPGKHHLRGNGPTITIKPAAMPAGTELSFGFFQLGPGTRQADAELINTSSYSCATTPTSLTRPLGHGLLSQVGPRQ
jgi:hypothetical protein